MDTVAIAFVFLLIFVAILIIATYRIRQGRIPELRQIQAYQDLQQLSSQATETGQPIHLSLGVGGVTNQTTADSLAGLTILDYFSEQSAATDTPPLVSVADPTLMLMAKNVSHRNNPQINDDNVQWIAPQPSAYAAGVMNLVHREKNAANVLVGHFGDEYLLIGEAATRQDGEHIGGSSVPSTLPFIYASAKETLIGEEIYVAGAYLQKKPFHLASLIAQDTLRSIIFWVILLGILLQTVS